MSRSRAWRRAQRSRIKAKRLRIQVGILGWDPVNLPFLIDTPTPCSCALCRNRRKDEGATPQERRHEA